MITNSVRCTLQKRLHFHDAHSRPFLSHAHTHTAADHVHEGTRTVSLNLKTGVEARSYADVGKAEKLKPMELELRRLEVRLKDGFRSFLSYDTHPPNPPGIRANGAHTPVYVCVRAVSTDRCQRCCLVGERRTLPRRSSTTLLG